MASLSRTAVLLLLLPVPGAVYLAASMEDVSASSQCLPSAEAVKQQYPGSWASWSTHVANHKGERCWFPAARETHARRVEAALRRTAHKLMRTEDKAPREETGVSSNAAVDAPLLYAVEMNELGWNMPVRNVVVTAGASGAVFSGADTAPSSFEERFEAARNVASVQKPSVIQRMMDPVGAIPNMP